jgi:hypothetical protein
MSWIKASGFTGHGKIRFSNEEILADLVIKAKTDSPIEFLKLKHWHNFFASFAISLRPAVTLRSNSG